MRYLKKSLLYSMKKIAVLIENDERDLYSEAITQVLKNLFILKSGNSPQMNMEALITDLKIPFSDEEKTILTELEQANRKRDKYLEKSREFAPELATSILEKITSVL